MNTTFIEINTEQFITNLKAIRQTIDAKGDNIKICLPVKANAYGHGLVPMSVLAQKYVDYLAVARLDEGAALRANSIATPILVFGAFNREDVPGLIANDLEITISSVFKATQVADYCRQTAQKAKIHLKIDIGMNRVGVRVETAPELFRYVASRPELHLSGVYSQLSCADSGDFNINMEQIAKFDQVVALARSINPNIICHLADSGGICYYPESYFDMVRPGVLSFGYFPDTPVESAPLNQIKPCLSLKSHIIYNKIVESAQHISYSRRYTTSAQTRVVTVAIGYGDGYPRCLSNIGEVLLNGNKYKISGAICMDMLMVDIGRNSVAYVGDEVVIIGRQGNNEISLADIAAKCDTIVNEILCRFNERLVRVYV